MQLAHDFRFTRFFELGVTSWKNCSWKSDVVSLCAEEARRLDGEILFRLLAAGNEMPRRPRTVPIAIDDDDDDFV
jgi:hypothetical protein